MARDRVKLTRDASPETIDAWLEQNPGLFILALADHPHASPHTARTIADRLIRMLTDPEPPDWYLLTAAARMIDPNRPTAAKLTPTQLSDLTIIVAVH